MSVVLDFSADQERALTAIDGWRYSRRTPHLELGGFAGCGKSTLVVHLADEWPGLAVCALAGKAAHVLRQKGVEHARTVHSLIYTPELDDRGRPRFVRRRELEGVSAVVVDEASMIDHLLMHDLLAFGLPVLFVGDHGQLEPIGTNPNLMKCPDLKLEHIHRQAEGNPILRLATAFREGRDVPYWSDGKGRLKVVPRSEATDHIRPGMQVICGFNHTRHRINQELRAMLGHVGPVQAGELLICLRNNRSFGIFNGQQLRVLEVGRKSARYLDLTLQADDDRVLYGVPCLAEQFGRDALQDFRDDKVVLLDWGYALTAHKSQGSEWDDVLVYEEIASTWDPQRWRYTVATRARERLVYCA